VAEREYAPVVSVSSQTLWTLAGDVLVAVVNVHSHERIAPRPSSTNDKRSSRSNRVRAGQCECSLVLLPFHRIILYVAQLF
jgi:hypothetical protein